jgi:hypothetical protein
MEYRKIYRGDDYTLSVEVKDADGNAYDLTGCTLFHTVKENESDSDDDAVIKSDVTTHTDPTNGESEIDVPDTDTDDLTPGDYYYDVQLKDASGNIYTLEKGVMTVEYDVTVRTTAV